MEDSISENLPKKKIGDIYKYPLIVGICFATFYILNDLIFAFRYTDLYEKPPVWQMILNFAAWFSVTFIVVRLQGEKFHDGFSTYGRAFGATMIMFFIFSFLYSIIIYFHYNGNDDLLEHVAEQKIKMIEQIFKYDDDRMEKLADEIRSGTTPFKMGLNIFIGYGVAGLMLSLIVCGFQKFIVRNYRTKDIFTE